MVVSLLGLLTTASVSQARTYCSVGVAWGPIVKESSGDGWCKNPDGTWSLYTAEKDTHPTKVYSQAEFDKFGKFTAGVDIEAGNTPDKLSAIAGGLTGAQIKAIKDMFTRLDTGELYANPAEADVGKAFVKTAVEIDELPSTDEVVAAGLDGASGGGVVLAGAGALALGVAIGTGVDELVGWPSFLSGSDHETEPGCATIYEETCIRTFKWTSGTHTEHSHNCKLIAEGAPSWARSAIGNTGKCSPVKKAYTWHEEYTCTGFCSEKGLELGGVGERSGGETVHAWELSDTHLTCPDTGGPVKCIGTVEEEFYKGFLWMNDSAVKELAFPSKELDELPQWNEGIEGEPGHEEEGTKHEEITPPEPTKVPLPATWFIGKQQEGGELPGIEGEPLEDPTQPEIPVVNPLEKWIEYDKRLEEDGFTNVEKNTVPETSIDPHTGPEGVIDVSPEPGTHAAPTTAIRVDVNPDDAPNPETGGIGPPTLPGIKFPNLAVACKSFPFGVPCWLIEEFESWSAVASAPEWGIDEFTIMGHKIPGAKVKLSVLEPIMERVRPAMLVFATIGLVLLFYKFATGGGPASSSQGDSSTSGARDESER